MSEECTMEYASRDELNGIGSKVNEMAIQEATCRGETRQRLDQQDKQHDENRGDIKELYGKVAEVKDEVTNLNGRLIGMGIVLTILIPLITSVLDSIIKAHP